MKGWVRLYRQIEDWEFYLKEPFDKARAWIDLFMLANHSDNSLIIRGNIVPIKRGQVGYSDLQLSQRWKWSRGKVKRFLGELETRQQIVQQKNRLINIKTIINYDKFQQNDTTDDTTDGTLTRMKRIKERKERDFSKKNPNKNCVYCRSGGEHQPWCQSLIK